MDLENLDKWARIKGIGVLGTGDFTHPLWFKELREKLEPAEPGLFRLRPGVRKLFLKKNHQEWMPKDAEVRFLLTVEISSIYSRGGKVRKIHNLIFAPSSG
ncbi:DNA helicase UvrD, partial [Candidatus Azambacteria bacterium]|nr:DNA helicase UvrD [Candidatus Azambacteria bacterium]